ncbi:MAG: hypothetical protein J5552_02305 [Prevotella sp.]|nr:hypothetical protein [Prevotella sp.]
MPRAAEDDDDTPSVTPTRSRRYPVLILNNATLTSENGPAIEVNSHDRFVIELHGENTITAPNGNAAISMGTLQSEAWGGGIISIIGEDGASLTIPAVEGVESGIHLAESSINMEDFAGDISGTNYGIRFQGWDPYDYGNAANCNMTFGKGMSLKLHGGEEALNGFNPYSMYGLGYEDKETKEWKRYELLESDIMYAEPIWDENGGVYGTQEWVVPEGGSEGYTRFTPATYLYFGDKLTVTVSSHGWATYIPKFDAQFEEGDAWIVTKVNKDAGTVLLEEVNAVEAYTPVLLKGKGTKTITIADYYDDNDDNLLSIYNGEEYEDDEVVYVLAKKDSGACFKQWTGAMSELKGRVVLLLSSELQGDGTRTFALEETGTQGISDTVQRAMSNAQRFFDLQGRSVNQPTKGLYIVNGKKAIIK